MTTSPTTATPTDDSWKARAERSTFTAWSGLLFGIGAIAFVDEAVFHQLLHWHHFYDLGTSDLGLVSDGVFHAIGWFATIAGLFMLAELRRQRALWWWRWIGGALLGAGTFQLYDGLVHHKLLGIHQIRYVDNLLPYDLAWNGAAGALIAVGAALLIATRRSRAQTARDTGARARAR